ncbi:MAG TPA: asparagine synthase (glutamine-hydrolyzing) [Cyclobacteriaceae bacterium]|nr:asparagine synthase (glutamine-hydrolyzing) [Cyclobacteriaceae bacterium]
MCGIGAILQRTDSGIPAGLASQFSASMAHRGPDGEGITYHPNGPDTWQLALIHRRLSIIDLSSLGSQPMSYDGDAFWIVFNGEIYNYLELKQTLISLGHSFRSNSDTEVILAAYKAYGTNAFALLRGMWAIVLYDRDQKKVIVSRDRLGIKPLYYYRTPGALAFASEIKQFTVMPGFVPRADKAVIKQYLQTGFERTDRTFFEQVQPVLPATFQEVDLATLEMAPPKSFWHPETIKSDITNDTEAALLLSDAFDESVRIHLRSDVPVGCQLSGGVDSSAVFAFMHKHYKGSAIHSFTVQFPGYEKDETPFVQRMLSGSTAVPHFTTTSPEGFLRDLDRFVWHHDEPVGSFAHYAGYVLAGLIAEQQIKVVLNGQGGDEVLGGYWQQYFSYVYSLTRRGRFGEVMSHLSGAMTSQGNGEFLRQIPPMLNRYLSRNRKQPFQFTRDMEGIPSLHFYQDYFSMDDQQRRIFEIRNLILPRLLKWDDRNLMAYGVEGRYPFLDHRLMETALRFDSSVLFRKGWTKNPLRLVVENKIPREIYQRKTKWGFETPQQLWLQNSLKPVFARWLKEDKPLDQILERTTIVGLAEQFWRTNSLEDAQALLRLFLLDRWFRVFSVRL